MSSEDEDEEDDEDSEEYEDPFEVGACCALLCRVFFHGVVIRGFLSVPPLCGP